MPGGFAEYVVVNHDKVFAISDKLSFEEASFVEPTACAVHGVDRIQPGLGDSCLMFGAGPTGIILAQLLHRAGVCKFVIADPNQRKLDLLAKLGFSDLVLMDRHDPSKHTAEIKKLQPNGFNIIIDATVLLRLPNDASILPKKGSKIVVYGVCAEDARISVSPYKIFSEEYKIIGSFAQDTLFWQSN